jgi:predicted TIM-barrel fold metal-dependent hydrolase
VREGRIFVGFDCDDEGLAYSVTRAGHEPFLFGSDFPHEVFNAETCRIEIQELRDRTDLTEKDKGAVLGENAARFYRLAESRL